jgi:hypothetical protein
MTRGLGGKSPANIAKHLEGIDFPADREDLVSQAEDNDADPEILDVLNRLPDQEYQSMADVMSAVGEVE